MRKTALVTAFGCLAAVSMAAFAGPMSPSMAVMPAPGKPFEVFQAEQASCKDYADSEAAGLGESRRRGFGRTLLTAALGAGLGGAVGGGDGAAIGAASGALAGGAMSARRAADASDEAQRRYDIAFEQCMYAKGNQVPGMAMAAIPPPPR